MEDGIYIKARRGDFTFDPDVIKLYAFRIYLRTKWRVEGKLKFVELTKEDRQTPLEPFLEIEMHEAQELMDSLWDCGLRPSEGSGSAGAMKKTEEHLDDMRTITFHLMKINKKQ